MGGPYDDHDFLMGTLMGGSYGDHDLRGTLMGTMMYEVSYGDHDLRGDLMGAHKGTMM